MNAKILVYIFVMILVVWSLNALNINQFFKKGRVYQATTCYFLIAVALIYLVSNFIIDIASIVNIIN